MATILKNQHVLAVTNLNEAANFYQYLLGFSIVAEPPGWKFLSKDNCILMLGECPDDIPPPKLGSHRYFAYFTVDDVDGYYSQIKAKAPNAVGELSDQPWGMREFSVQIPNGHTLMIGSTIS